MVKLKKNYEKNGQNQELLIIIDAHGNYKNSTSNIRLDKNITITVTEFYEQIQKIKEKVGFSGMIYAVHSSCQFGGVKRNIEKFDNLIIGFLSSKKDVTYAKNSNIMLELILNNFLNDQEYIINPIIKGMSHGINLDIYIPYQKNIINLEHKNKIYSKNKFTLLDINNIAQALDRFEFKDEDDHITTAEEVVKSVQEILLKKVDFLKNVVENKNMDNNLISKDISLYFKELKKEDLSNIVRKQITSVDDVKLLLLNIYTTILNLNYLRTYNKQNPKKELSNFSKQNLEIYEIINRKIFKSRFLNCESLGNSLIAMFYLKYEDLDSKRGFSEDLIKLSNKNYFILEKLNIGSLKHKHIDIFSGDGKIILQNLTKKYMKLEKKDIDLEDDAIKFNLLLDNTTGIEELYNKSSTHAEELMKKFTKLNSKTIKVIRHL